jgi:uncharacterized domain HDIG
MKQTVSNLLCEMAETPAGPAEYHQEGSVLQHTMKVVNEMEYLVGNDPASLCAAFFHDIGKIKTPDDQLPHHYDHDMVGAELIASMDDLFSDVKMQKTAQVTAKQHMRFKKLPEMKASKIIRLVELIDTTYLSAETMVDLIEADRVGREPALETDRRQFESRIEAVREADSRLNGVDIANDQHRLQKKVEFYRDLLET